MRRQLLTMYTLIAMSLVATVLALLHCAEWNFVYDNPCDKTGINYQGCDGDNPDDDDDTGTDSTGSGGDNGGNVGIVDPSSVTKGTFTDSRGEKVYKTVTIGTQTWMAENLNYDVPDNTTDVCYSNNADNCAKYGRLYNWSTAMGGASSSNRVPSGVRGVCPSGWHLPSSAEWTTLTDAVGGTSKAGTKLKSSTGWNSYSGIPFGTDDYGFSALPGGYGNSDGYFNNAGSYGRWWSATENNAYDA